MRALHLMHSSVFVASLIHAAVKGYVEARSDGDLRGMPLPLTLLVAPICIDEMCSVNIVNAPSFEVWVARTVRIVADLPDQYAWFTGTSLRALAILLASDVLIRNNRMGMPEFTLAEPVSAVVRFPEDDSTFLRAAAQLGRWWAALPVPEVLRRLEVRQ